MCNAQNFNPWNCMLKNVYTQGQPGKIPQVRTSIYVETGGCTRTRRRRVPIVSSDQQQAESFWSGCTNLRGLADTFPRPWSYKSGSSIRRYAAGLQEEERVEASQKSSLRVIYRFCSCLTGYSFAFIPSWRTVKWRAAGSWARRYGHDAVSSLCCVRLWLR